MPENENKVEHLVTDDLLGVENNKIFTNEVVDDAVEVTDEKLNEITEEDIMNMSPEERRELALALKRLSQPRFDSRKHIGNKTVNKFDANYKEKRRKRNKVARNSRSLNRKK